ncbi:FkbM family methyltransferase [Pyxidicoccus parkwayensis]|uniref:FkbM family methyltransferase n=1 Tax=Pyxidicoccus parkwayensis TaxID=2813578 RepID=A0ABX7P5J2_9BACT|nr:FkbM family methyltransferase [Pyxidicoccus parkwaysis]QSQ25696.1 FkbM family methyltransferase [Pyxidicoccus parkwaysis]
MHSSAFNQLLRCRHGEMLFNQNDEVIGRSLREYGEYSELEMEMLGRFLKPGDTVVDLGANIGAHTLYFARQVGPTGRVIAFEPQRVVFQTLCANAALNSLTNVWALQAGAGEAEGQTRLPPLDYSRPDNFGAVSLDGAEEGEPVPVRTVDSLELASCALLKLDVEGWEVQALRGAKETLARCQPLLYLENHNAHQAEALIAHVQEAGYRIHWHLPALYNPDNFLGQAGNIFPDWFSVNILCVPEARKDVLAAIQPLHPGPDAESRFRFGGPEVSRMLIPFAREHVARLAGLTAIFDKEIASRREQRREHLRQAP